MSREIKFRMLVTSGDRPWHHWVFPQSIEDCKTAFNHYNLDSWTQYTGLKDKNGVEIYEGDILGKRPYGYLKSDGTKDGRYKGKEWECFTVEWGEYDASEAGLVSGYEYETDGKYAGWNIVVGGYDDDLKDNEVIGNIYENPELLTKA